MDKKVDIKKLFAELGESTCPSAEILSAFLEEILPEESNQIISRHLLKCQICRQSIQILKDAAREDFLDEVKEAAIPPMPNAVKEKFELSAKINSIKAEITVNVARQLLPETSWPRIPFTISNIRRSADKHDKTQYNNDSARTEYAVAAFSSDSTADDHQTYSVIERVVLFADILCGMLIERCARIDDIEGQLISSVSDVCGQVDGVTFDDRLLSLIQEITLHSFKSDE